MPSLHQEPRLAGGRIEAEISQNTFVRKDWSLDFRVILDYDPLAVDGETIAPQIRLGPFDFGVRDWQSLTGVTWTRPEHEEMIFVDGVQYPAAPQGNGVMAIGVEQTPVACDRIRFGSITDGMIGADLRLRLREPAAGGVVIERASTPLKIGPISILGDIFTGRRPGADDAQALAGRFLNLDSFEVRSENEIIRLYARSQ